MVADGGGRLFDACEAALHPQAPALHVHAAPPVPAAHIARLDGLAFAGNLHQQVGEGWGPWGADVNDRHLVTPPWEAGQPKALLVTRARRGLHSHQGHAALAEHHHTCRTGRIRRMPPVVPRIVQCNLL